MTIDIGQIVERLLDAYDGGSPIDPITSSEPDFGLDAAYDVLAEIESRRRRDGWIAVGRKIGFTNRNLWDPYGVDAPMWARVWDRTLIEAPDGRATVSLGFPELRIEPEVVFGTETALDATGDPAAVLAATAWIAPGFEFVWSPYPGWRFALPDCTAAFGLHGALVLGPKLHLSDDNRSAIASALPSAQVTLSRNDEAVDRGVGSNALDGPAHALAHLTRVLAGQPRFELIGPGEIITTGTITDAWPVEAGQAWTSDYGTLGLSGLTVSFR